MISIQVRMAPETIAKMHVADLRGAYDARGLSLDELRAVYAALPAAFDADSQGEKAAWREAARERLVALALREAEDKLLRREVRHPVYDALDAVGGPFDPDAKADAAVAAPSTTNLESELAAVRLARRSVAAAPTAPGVAPRRHGAECVEGLAQLLLLEGALLLLRQEAAYAGRARGVRRWIF